MTRLAAHRLSVGLARGWEGRIFRRQADPGETNHPIIHLANFALPEERGDFGGGVTEYMEGADVLVVVFEYGPASAGTALFARQGLPEVSAEHFSAVRLQRTIPGQTGAQLFFSVGGRPFCLYVVVADERYLDALVPHVNAAVAGLEVA